MNCEVCGARLELGYICPNGHGAPTGIAAPDELETLRGALLFYASEDNYQGDPAPVLADGGQLAREALAL